MVRLISHLSCPPTPDIRLSLAAYGRVAATLKAFAPDAIHIATGNCTPGLAARRWCMANQLRFTSRVSHPFSRSTFPRPRARLPLSASYAFMRSSPAPGVMARAPWMKRAGRLGF